MQGSEIGSNGTLVVAAGASASGTTVANGGTVNVLGVDTGATIGDGGTETVASGGTASDTVIADPGLQIVDAGGTAIGAVVSGGEQDVFGTAISTVVEGGKGFFLGSQVVEAGGLASITTISSGGAQVVSAGGTAVSTTVNSGARQDIAGLAIGDSIAAGAFVNVLGGGTLELLDTQSATGVAVQSGGTLELLGTASKQGAVFLSGATLEIGSGNTLSNYAVANGITLRLLAGGAASGTIINGGAEYVASGGSAAGVAFGGTSATLSLEDPSGLGGTVSSWQIGDVIDFVRTPISSAGIVSGSSLSVSERGQTFTYQLAGLATDTQAQLQSDGAGGTEVVLTHVAPTVAISIDHTDVNLAASSATITFTFTQAPTDFSLGDVTASGGSLGNLSGSGNVYTATFTASANTDTGSASVSVTSGSYHDVFGTAGAGGSTSFTVDTVTPTVTVSGNNSNVNLANSSAIITFAFSEPPKAFTLVDTSASGGTLSGFTMLDASDYTATFTPAASTDGTASVRVTAGSWQEINGNPGSGGSTSFTVDTVTPTVTVMTSNSDVNVASNTATVTFTFSEAPTDFDLTHVSATGGSLSNFAGSGAVYTATFTGTPGIDINNASVSVDNAWHEGNGNAGSAGATDNFVVDTVTPAVTVTTSSTDVNVANNTATVTFSFSEAPTNFSLAHVSATGGQLSNFGGSGTVYTATFTGNAGTDISNAKVSIDNTWHEGNGNAGSAGATGTFVVDTVTPTVTVTASNSDVNVAYNTATVTFTFSEAPTDFSLGHVTAVGGTLSNFAGSGTVYTATFTGNLGIDIGNAKVSVDNAR